METFQALLDQYPDQIRFVYRDFPVVGGGAAGTAAALAANCAIDQDAYWDFHDAIFTGEFGISPDAFTSIAEDLGLDTDELGQCIESEKYAEEVQNDLLAGRSIGVSGTPTFFINGIPLVGAQPFANFAQVIDSELEGES
jgi:protein-disulfide isomerase